MRMLAKRGDLRLYETTSGHWIETKLDLEQTDLTSQAAAALVKEKKARKIWNAPRTAVTWVEYEDSAQKIIDHLRPLLAQLWADGRLQKPAKDDP